MNVLDLGEHHYIVVISSGDRVIRSQGSTIIFGVDQHPFAEPWDLSKPGSGALSRTLHLLNPDEA